MPLFLEVVENEKDFDEIYRYLMLYAAFGEPYNSLRKWFMPVHSTVEATIEAAKERCLSSWKQHDNIRWLKVIDTESGVIVGAAEWEIRDKIEDPDKPQMPIQAYWHLDGSEEQDFASKLLTGLKGFMKERMTRPHLELKQLVVHPDHRRRGIGRMLVEWGTKKADELGLESCVESVPFATPMYEKLGYGTFDCLYPNVGVSNPSPKWKEFEAEDLRVFLIW